MCMYVGLKPRVESVNVTLINVDQLIREIRFEIEDIVVGLDSLPEGTSSIHQSTVFQTEMFTAKIRI